MTTHTKILILLATGISTLFSFCAKEEDFDVQNLNHNVIMILGHAGMGEFYKYPNNTLEAIAPVLGIGADGTEMDVTITKDSVLILFHDKTLDGRTKCGGYGKPYDYNWDEIEHCAYNTLVDNIPIYTVDEIFSSIPNVGGYYFSFDTKLDPEHFYNNAYRDQFLRAIQRVCEKYDIGENIFLEGDLGLLTRAKALGMKTKGIVVGSTVDKASENGIFGIGYTVDASKAEIDYAHQKGIYVMVWGAKSDVGNKKGIKLNPDILVTDKPIPALMLFERFNFDYPIP